MAALVAVGIFVVGVRKVQPFLAVTAPLPGSVLVVEGWMPDYCLETVLAETRRAPCPALFVTGGPIERGEPMAAYKTYAELGAATLVALGANTPPPQAVPAREAYKDRTYTSAIALRDWLRAHGPMPEKLTLVSQGTHARRSRLLFEKAFGPGVEIGIIAVPDRSYDARRWWRSSQGFRTVTDELIGYGYARFVFSP